MLFRNQGSHLFGQSPILWTLPHKQSCWGLNKGSNHYFGAGLGCLCSPLGLTPGKILGHLTSLASVSSPTVSRLTYSNGSGGVRNHQGIMRQCSPRSPYSPGTPPSGYTAALQ